MTGKRIKIMASVLAAATVMTGCGTKIYDMTDEEQQLIVNYSAYALSKHNIYQPDGMTSATETETEEQDTSAAETETETAGSGVFAEEKWRKKRNRMKTVIASRVTSTKIRMPLVDAPDFLRDFFLGFFFAVCGMVVSFLHGADFPSFILYGTKYSTVFGILQ